MPPSKRPADPLFSGTDRFVVQRRMGAGGMGVVYQALDRERNQVVALKTLRDVDAAALVRFKREFRSLADISHPNLVSLYELISVGDRLFFTMELVSGFAFLRWVRRGDETPAPDDTAELSAPAESATDVTSLGKRTPGSKDKTQPQVLRGGSTLDLGRLRRALPQLAQGVAAIHDRGLLHRDLKPSNVLVTTDGRVKILDFGLVTELDRELNTATVEGLAGTAAYMSPEQGARQPLGPASDWYAVGVVLYEALTGRLPFVGGATDVLMDKQRFEPPRAREVGPDVPADLDELSAELLRRDPEARPNAREVLRRLGVDTGMLDVSSGPSTRTSSSFIGRGRQMGALADAFLASRRRLSVVFMHGRSGMGKSALLRRFLDGIEEREEALVITGRCYERESVPYKAVDSVIDALSQHLSRLPRLEAEGLMPRDVTALARLFPALRQVEAVTAAPRRAEIPDPQELRRRAFGALRELLARLADRRPLVLAIDDLQWGDADSAALLAALVRPPDAPALLFIASHRSEEEADNAFLAQLRGELARQGEEVRDIDVGPLDQLEAVSLAQALLEDDGAASYDKALRIAEEAGGNPFFIDELARHVREGDGDRPARISLDEVLRARLRRLPPDAARLLAIVATAGRPIALTVAQRAAEVHDPALVALLKAGNLVRTRGSEPTVVECFHDRIREAQLALLDKERAKKAHMRLAIALESSPRPDAEALAVHFAAAGERIRAAEFASEAASRASEALAFDRAARLYRLAIELTTARVRETEDLERTGDRSVMRFLYAHLGDALANAGRGAEAAAAYLQATARAPAAEVLELRRRAASQLLLSGHFSDGIAAMRDVLASVGMRFTETPTETITALLWRRARIRMRGLGYKRRDVSQVPQEQLTRIDVADGASTGLGMVDSMRAASFQAQHLLLALEAGEPRRVARALSAEACFHSMRGIRTAKRCERVLGLLGALAEELDTPEIRAQHEGSVGIVAFQHGEWARSLEYCQRAETIFRDRLTGFRWELSTTQIFAIYAESLLGRVRAFRLRLPAILKEAAERGDLYTQTVLQTAVSHTAWLTEGQPAKARQQVAEALARWNVPDTMHLQHFNATMSEISIDMYNGDGVAAYDRVTRAWKQFESSLLMYVQTLRVSAHFARGRAAVAATRAGRKGLLGGAARDARVLQRQKAPYAVGLGTMVEAGATLLSGNLERGAAALRRAAEACDKAEMSLHAEAARWELGRVIGGDEGAALVAAAERALTAEGVRDPAAMVVTFTGGLTR